MYEDYTDMFLCCQLGSLDALKALLNRQSQHKLVLVNTIWVIMYSSSSSLLKLDSMLFHYLERQYSLDASLHEWTRVSGKVCVRHRC